MSHLPIHFEPSWVNNLHLSHRRLISSQIVLIFLKLSGVQRLQSMGLLHMLQSMLPCVKAPFNWPPWQKFRSLVSTLPWCFRFSSNLTILITSFNASVNKRDKFARPQGLPCMQERLDYFFRPKNDFFSGFPLAMNSLYAFGLVNTNFLSSSMKVTFGGSLDLKLLKE